MSHIYFFKFHDERNDPPGDRTLARCWANRPLQLLVFSAAATAPPMAVSLVESPCPSCCCCCCCCYCACRWRCLSAGVVVAWTFCCCGRRLCAADHHTCRLPANQPSARRMISAVSRIIILVAAVSGPRCPCGGGVARTGLVRSLNNNSALTWARTYFVGSSMPHLLWQRRHYFFARGCNRYKLVQ